MGIVLKPATDGRLSLKGFVEHVRQVIDLQEPDSLIGLASPLCMLANDPDVVAHKFNDALRRSLDADVPPDTLSGAVRLAQEDQFVLCANIWMPASLGERAGANGIVAGQIHNHNTSLITVGYRGPGCDVDLYAYSPTSGAGAVGEHVDLRFVERTRVAPRTVVIYRETIDAHARFAPASLSVALTLSIVGDRQQQADQLRFDPHAATIAGFGPQAAVNRRASVVRLAGELGNDGTLDVLDALLRRSHCRRVREAAVIAASRLTRTSIDDRTRVIDRALRDSNELVRQRAEAVAAQLSAAT